MFNKRHVRAKEGKRDTRKQMFTDILPLGDGIGHQLLNVITLNGLEQLAVTGGCETVYERSPVRIPRHALNNPLATRIGLYTLPKRTVLII